jgi:XRE family transcriptional regulator, master regulator for biofilm formation
MYSFFLVSNIYFENDTIYNNYKKGYQQQEMKGTMNGEYIRNRRLEKKLSLSELAHLANVSKTYLSSLERNIQKNPSLDIVEKIAGVLEMDTTLLINNLKNKEKDESITESTHNLIESYFQLKKYIEELDTIQLEKLKDFIEFTLWKRK